MVSSPVKVSPALAGPRGPTAGFAPGVRSSMRVSGSARTVTVVGACGPEPDSTRTSAGGGSAAPANSALPRARPPAHRAARPALMGAVL